jgi:hypothetical protein
VAAPGTAVQVKVIDSNGWNFVVPPRGGLSVGVPGEVAPVPVTTTLRAADQAPCATLFTACTRQKYVPLASPLTVACVVGLVVEPCCTTAAKEAVGLTCQL